MTRPFRFSFLVLVLACPFSIFGQTVSDLVKNTVDAVVLIVVSDDTGKAFAEGSGFIISSDGKIITNHHVIANAHSAIAKLNNGSFFVVDGVLADDPDNDIAILKVNGKNLPCLTLSQAKPSVGDHVVAIGSPLGLDNTVSDGIVSSLRDDGKGRSWIQTTAPVSHGNSGGPLLTMDSKVIGIITWKFAEGENLNFAVPSAVVSMISTNPTAQPLGQKTFAASASPESSTTSSTTSRERIWTSMTSGRDYRVRIDGDYIYAQWVNMPTALQSTTAFVRSQVKKSGDKWVGKSVAYLPFKDGRSVKWCRFEDDFEIDSVSESRIEGRSKKWSSVNVKKCEPENMVSDSFVWIPK